MFDFYPGLLFSRIWKTDHLCKNRDGPLLHPIFRDSSRNHSSIFTQLNDLIYSQKPKFDPSQIMLTL